MITTDLPPAIADQDTKTYAKALADLGLVPVTKNAFSDTPVGKPFGTVPAVGTDAKAKHGWKYED